MSVIFVSGGVGQIMGHVTSGILLFFAFYMMIEPTTSPTQKKSRIAFGLLTGVFAALLYTIWLSAAFVVALFLADLCVPILDKMFKPKIVKSEELQPVVV